MLPKRPSRPAGIGQRLAHRGGGAAFADVPRAIAKRGAASSAPLSPWPASLTTKPLGSHASWAECRERMNRRARVFYCLAMYLIRLERRVDAGRLVVMWLKSGGAVVRWGPREDAIRFATKGEARRVARTLKLQDAW